MWVIQLVVLHVFFNVPLFNWWQSTVRRTNLAGEKQNKSERKTFTKRQ